VLVDTKDDAEPPVEGVEDDPVEGFDLLAKAQDLVHPSSFSGFSHSSVLPVRLNPGAHP
jgi:hypothetical protein